MEAAREIRYWDMQIDEAIIDQHMVEEVWRELTLEQKARAAKAAASIDIPELICQRRSYVFYEPSHELIGVFNPYLFDIGLALRGLLGNRESNSLNVYTLENSSVIDFYGISI